MTRKAAIVLLAVALSTIAVSTAAAETSPTAQAGIAHAGFLASVGAPPSPAAICMVDTGVTPNNDTAGVVDRLAVAGDDVSDASPNRHGTLMAMMIGAPTNGWGMVGTWPAARVLSVRASVPGSDSFTAPGYVNGMQRCYGVKDTYGIRVILLALSSAAPLTPDEQTYLDNAVATAHGQGINVVAAAGNLNGASVGSPANTDGILSVGGAGIGGASCASSAAGADLLAPGCGLDAADPASGEATQGADGTSEASAIVAAVLAALRAHRPDLTWQDAEALLASSADAVAGGRLLNSEAAFNAAGLASVVASAAPAPAAPSPTTPPIQSLPSLAPASKPKRHARPQASIRKGKRSLLIVIKNRPAGVTAIVRVRAGTKTIKVVKSRRSHIAVRVTRWTSITVQYPQGKGRRASATLVISARRKR